MADLSQDLTETLQAGYRYALSLTHHHYEAEDLVQEAWIRVWRKYGERSTRALLFAAVRNRFLDGVRRGRVLSFSGIDDEEAVTDTMDDGSKTSRPTGAVLDMDVLLAHLKPEEREALYLNVVLSVLSWQGWQPDASERIGREVLTNYAKHLDPEVRASDFETLTAGLSRLGFALAPSGETTPLRGWQVEGGRYCSLAGELAAQVNLTDAQGRKSLLYVVELSEKLSAAEPGERRYADARVRLWQDAGRLYVQAIPKKSNQ